MRAALSNVFGNFLKISPVTFTTLELSSLPHFQQKTGGHTGEETYHELINRQPLWISLLRWPPVVFCFGRYCSDLHYYTD
jgi:hypothetical protein